MLHGRGKQKTEQCGATLERPSPCSGLIMANDDDNDDDSTIATSGQNGQPPLDPLRTLVMFYLKLVTLNRV